MTKCIYINIDILKWARRIAGYSLSQIAKSFKEIADWENGRNFPTYLELEKLAKKYKIPIAVFFFPIIPKSLPLLWKRIKNKFRTLK